MRRLDRFPSTVAAESRVRSSATTKSECRRARRAKTLLEHAPARAKLDSPRSGLGVTETICDYLDLSSLRYWSKTSGSTNRRTDSDAPDGPYGQLSARKVSTFPASDCVEQVPNFAGKVIQDSGLDSGEDAVRANGPRMFRAPVRRRSRWLFG